MEGQFGKYIELSTGNIPDGFIKEDFWIIPDDWEKCKMSNVFQERVEYALNNEDVPLFSLTIEDGIVGKTERYERKFLVTKEEDNYKLVYENDFAYNPMNIRFGAVAMHKLKHTVAVSAYYNIFYVKNGYSPEFIEQFLKSYRMLHFYNKYAEGSLVEKKRLHYNVLLKSSFRLPPVLEQRKIMKILNTWEKAIALEKQLIKKIELQKQGAMKELLTGEMRLPGFIDKWEEINLSSIAKINSDSLGRDVDGDYEFKYYDLSAVEKGDISHPNDKVKYSYAPSRARRIFQKDDILMSTVRPNLKGFALVDFEADSCIASTGFAVLRMNDSKYTNYVYQYLFGQHIEQQIESLIVGSNYPAINNSEVSQLKIKIPKNPNEASEIGRILQLFDASIKMHQQIQKSFELQKKGLMQLLLTGIVRVNVETN